MPRHRRNILKERYKILQFHLNLKFTLGECDKIYTFDHLCYMSNYKIRLHNENERTTDAVHLIE